MKDENRRKILHVLLLMIFISMTAGIIAGGSYYIQRLEHRVKIEVANGLTSVADLKVRQISEWRQEKIRDTSHFSSRYFFYRTLKSWLEKGEDERGKKELLLSLALTAEYYDFESICFLDMTGRKRLCAGKSEDVSVTGNLKSLTRDALTRGTVAFGDFYRCPICGKVHIDVAAPVIDGGGKPLGALIFRIDPDKYLYPLIESWPAPSKTAETLLVRRDGDDVVFLNRLRNSNAAALALRFPVTEERVAAVKAVLGKQGVVDSYDYRNRKVIACLKKIPDSPWYLVAKVDYDEAFGPFQQQLRGLLFMMILLIILSGFVIYVIFAVMEKKIYERLLKAEAEKLLVSKRFEYLMKQAGDGILLIDEEGNIKEFNEKALKTYGYHPEELLSFRLGKLAAEPQSDEAGNISNQEELVYEALHRKKDGSKFPVEISQKMLEIEGKKFTQAIIRDITERKLAEEAVRKSEEHYRSLFDNMSEGFALCEIITDADGKPIDFSYIEVNQAFGRQSGLSPGRIVGKRAREVLPELEESWISTYGAVALTGEPAHFEGFVAEIGRWFNVHCFSPGKGYFAALFIDITARKEMEEHLVRKNGELEDFARKVGHELKNNLVVISRLLEMSKDNIELLKKRSPYIIESANKLMSFVDRSLELAKAGRVISQKKEMNLEPLVSGIFERLKPPGVDAELSVRDLPAPVFGDVAGLEEVFSNLISNSVKYRDREKEKLEITIAQRHFDSQEEIVYRDNGQGVEEGILGHIFEMAYTSTPREGYGFGLPIVQKIIEAHGGHIRAESGGKGKGMTFIITLPYERTAKSGGANE